jgi:hypothetical protein
MIEVRDFTVDISDTQIEDLRERLARARLPEAEPVDDWSQGVPLAYLRELAEYWARDYDMSRVATRLNALSQFHAAIREVALHQARQQHVAHRARRAGARHPAASPRSGWPRARQPGH